MMGPGAGDVPRRTYGETYRFPGQTGKPDTCPVRVSGWRRADQPGRARRRRMPVRALSAPIGGEPLTLAGLPDASASMG